MIKMISNKISGQNKNIFINIIIAFAVRGASMLLALFTLPAYISYFNNQTVLGIWFTILSILNWILMFDLGLGHGLRNKLPAILNENDDKKAQNYISTTYFSTVCIVIIGSLLGALIIPEINWNTILNVENSLVQNEVLAQSVIIVFIGIMVQFVLKLITSILFAIQKSAMVNILVLLSNILIFVSLKILPSSSLEHNLIMMSIVNVLAVNVPLFIATVILFSKRLKNMKPKISMIEMKYLGELLNIGLSLLWLQLVFMLISSTNEILITLFISPKAVVEYQAYFKIFNSVAQLFTLALVPIWSAVTKAQVERNYSWIKKCYTILLYATLGCLLLELATIPILQFIMDLWLGKNTIQVQYHIAFIFAISSFIFTLHYVNTAIGNGLSYFKVQMILMTFAAVINIPLAYLCVKILGNWTGVVLANILSLLPYELLAPFFTFRYLRKQNTT